MDIMDLEPELRRLGRRRRSENFIVLADQGEDLESLLRGRPDDLDDEVRKDSRPAFESNSTTAEVTNSSSCDVTEPLGCVDEEADTKDRSSSSSSVPHEFSGVHRPLSRCRTSSEPLFLRSSCPSDLQVVTEDYDPRKQEYIRAVSEEREMELELRLLRRQIRKLRRSLVAREALLDPPPDSVMEGYREALAKMEEQAALLARGPFAVPLDDFRGLQVLPPSSKAEHKAYFARPKSPKERRHPEEDYGEGDSDHFSF